MKNPPAGSEDWFGWLTHELSHDFWHEHPAFELGAGTSERLAGRQIPGRGLWDQDFTAVLGRPKWEK